MRLGFERLLVIVVAVALAASGTACKEIEPEPEAPCEADELGCVEIPKGEPLVLGTLLDGSGPRSDVGIDSRNGVLLAADYIDGSFDGTSGKLLGHEISFEHKDEGCTPEGGKYGARELVDWRDDLEVVGVIGTTCTAGGLGVADQILGEEGIPMLSPSATSPYMTGPDRAGFFFRFAHNARTEPEVLARFAYEELAAREALVVELQGHFDPDDPQRFVDSFTAMGGDVPERLAVPRGPLTIEPLLSDVRPVPDVVFLSLGPEEIVGAISAVESAFPRADVLSSLWTFGPATDLEDSNLRGVYVPIPAPPNGPGFYEDEFLPAYRSRFGAPSSSYHANAFDAMSILLDAIHQVAILDGDTLLIQRTALRDQIALTESHRGLSGELRCTERGDCNPDAELRVVRL